MKNIFLIFLIFIFFNYSYSINYEWNYKNTVDTISIFNNQSSWTPSGIPGSNDNITLANGGFILVYDQYEAYVNNFNLSYGFFINTKFLTVKQQITIDEIGYLLMYMGGATEAKTITLDGMIYCDTQSPGSSSFDCFIQHSTVYIRNFGELSVEDNAEISLYDDTIVLTEYGRILSGVNSHVALMGKGIYLYDNSKIENTVGGTYNFNNTLNAFDSSSIEVSKSVIYIYEYMMFMDKSSLNISQNSNLVSKSSLYVYDIGFIMIAGKSTAIFEGYMALFNTSYLFVEDNSIAYVKELLYSSESSILSISGNSTLYVEGQALFGSVINDESSLVIQGSCLISGILSNIKGTFIVLGEFNFFSLVGYFDKSYVGSKGDFNLYGGILANQSTFEIVQGNFNVYDYAYLMIYDSKVFVDGFLSISNTSYLNIERTEFYISENGKIDSLGNIYLNKETEFNNTGTLNIHTGIYYTNDTTIKSNSISLLNSGTLNILQESININVGINNNGNINLNNKSELFIYDLNHNDGTIDLSSGGKLKSDNNIRINGGNLQGNGIVDGSISQTNGIVGSKNKINNIIINGSYSGSGSSKMIIIIDSLESFSTLEILDDIDFTGEIEIRFSITFIKDIQSGKYNLTNYQNNNSNNNLLNSASSSSSSSNQEIKINLINFNSNNNSKNSFNNIKFKTYDPSDNSGQENTNDYDGCNVSPQKSEKSFSILFNENDCSKKSKLKGGVIAAIVICCAVGIVGVAFLIHYRERIRLFRKSGNVQRFSKNIRNSLRNSISLKPTNK